MAVVHDYKCPAHGFFESREPVCPHGCTSDVQMVFLQAVGMKSDSTKHADTTLKELAKDYGMSDIKSSREGDHQQHALLGNKQHECNKRRNRQTGSRQERCHIQDGVVAQGG